MTLAGLYIYPIKSCAGIALERAEVARRGLACDRRWMVVDPEGRFITQRTQPRMALVRVALEDNSLRLEAPGMPPLDLPRRASTDRRRTVMVWGDWCDAIEQPAAGAWFSRFLGTECSVVHMPDDVRRAVDPERARPDDIVSFADGFPCLLTSEDSLEELNGRLPAPVSMLRFRPNIVVRGAAPFAEDGWARLRIGAVDFRVPKRCARCTIPTVDPQTGRRGKEPLRTLARYRREGDNVMFGVNLVHDAMGELRLGDPVEPH